MEGIFDQVESHINQTKPMLEPESVRGDADPKDVQPDEEKALKDDFQSLREIIAEEGGAKGIHSFSLLHWRVSRSVRQKASDLLAGTVQISLRL
jgi:hypothetical protein